MIEDDHVETLSYCIQMSSKDQEVLLWLEMNGLKINNFSEWFENTPH